jgi:hypothetical protein
MAKAPRTKPAPLGSVVPSCRYQIIDGDRWKTLAEGQIDAPNPGRKFMRENGLTGMWVQNFMGRRYVTLEGSWH